MFNFQCAMTIAGVAHCELRKVIRRIWSVTRGSGGGESISVVKRSYRDGATGWINGISRPRIVRNSIPKVTNRGGRREKK